MPDEINRKYASMDDGQTMAFLTQIGQYTRANVIEAEAEAQKLLTERKVLLDNLTDELDKQQYMEFDAIKKALGKNDAWRPPAWRNSGRHRAEAGAFGFVRTWRVCILPGALLLPPDLPEGERRRAIEATLVKREGRPEKIAQALHFFLDNDFVTGVCLPVDGGRPVYAPDSVWGKRVGQGAA
jgi:hypothetical protein